MHTQKFLDGSPVPADYQTQVTRIISAVADITDPLSPEEMDEFERQATPSKHVQIGPLDI